MTEDRKLQVQGTVAAPPEQVFALLADPRRHPDIDGAGMVRGVEGEVRPVRAVGDSFVMNMNQDGIGDYRMRSVIVEFEQDRRIAWAPAIHPPGALSHVIGELDPSGHVYAWELEPTGDGGTALTHTYDWSGVQDEAALPLYPRVSVEQMSATIERIDQAAR
ncbi:MAG TPA: SRPBCC family protein [Pseudonocardia sp.]|jgi:uncharacterized protein YndB with AHSA1/START domain|nr:SRPBCC family protein [Pseudonocardia sp.]